MPSPPSSLLSYLRVMAAAWRNDPRNDAELLVRFAEFQDEAAFATLVCRHGPLVWQTCRRVLGNTSDTEDAFQVAFLALARKASQVTIVSVASWLHQVARRAAMDVLSKSRRSQELERQLRTLSKPELEDSPARAELYAALDEELAALPERLRIPLVLRYLEGKALEEVARIVGCCRRVLGKRLTRGEAMLRENLKRRGLTVGVVSIGALMGSTATVSAVPAHLISRTARAAVAFRSGTLTSGVAEAARAVLEFLPSSSFGTIIMRKSLWIVLACCLGLGGAALVVCRALSAWPGEAGPAAMPAPSQPVPDDRAVARVDCYGDPLPAHALARVGTTRLWQPFPGSEGFLAFSPDGKMLASSVDRESVCLWDAATGKEIHRLTMEPIKRKYPGSWPFVSLGFSPDSKTLVAVNWAQAACFWEVATGKFLRIQEYRGTHKNNAQSFLMAFPPDGKMLCFGDCIVAGEEDRRAFVWDLATGKDICQLKESRKRVNPPFSFDMHPPIYVKAFSPDGKTLATVENEAKQKGQKRILSSSISLWDINTGKEIRQLTQTSEVSDNDKGRGIQEVVFSCDNKTLVSADPWHICVWEVATGKKIRQLDKGQEYPRIVALSPDGKVLSGGVWDGGHLWDIATGKEIHSFTWEHLSTVVLSPDGKTLAVADEAGAIRLWDVATGKEIGPRRGYQRGIQSVAYSPDSKTLASMNEGDGVHLWEVATGKEIRQLVKCKECVHSPDGKILVSIIGSRGIPEYHLWDTGTGKTIRKLDTDEIHPHLSLRPAVFTPDGKKLVALARGQQPHNMICVWEVATGKKIYTLETEVDTNRGINVGIEDDWPCAISPDGRMLAEPGKDNTVMLRELATGQPIRQMGDPMKPREKTDRFFVRFIAFSPNGRALATSGSGDDKVHLWEIASGKEIRQLGGWKNCKAGYTMAFSPDSRMLATAVKGKNNADRSFDPKVHIWDLISGKEIIQLTGHQDIVRSLAFSPDGKTLASGSDDLTCLVWDISSVGRLTVPPQILSKEKLEAAWADLAKDPAKAYVAIRTLQAVPTQAVPLLRARVRPVALVSDPKQLQRWIADLDDNNFTVREKAQQEIEKLGEPAIPALRQALKSKPGLEMKRRLQTLLPRLESQLLVIDSPERLRELRAVQVLEYIGTAEAQQVLQILAKGLAVACLTVDAQAALTRLAKRPETKP